MKKTIYDNKQLVEKTSHDRQEKKIMLESSNCIKNMMSYFDITYITMKIYYYYNLYWNWNKKP